MHGKKGRELADWYTVWWAKKNKIINCNKQNETTKINDNLMWKNKQNIWYHIIIKISRIMTDGGKYVEHK